MTTQGVVIDENSNHARIARGIRSAPAKLAAGQVWRVPFFSHEPFTLTRQRVAELGAPWETAEGGPFTPAPAEPR